MKKSHLYHNRISKIFSYFLPKSVFCIYISIKEISGQEKSLVKNDEVFTIYYLPYNSTLIIKNHCILGKDMLYFNATDYILL